MIPRILAVVGQHSPECAGDAQAASSPGTSLDAQHEQNTRVQNKVLEVFADLPQNELYMHIMPGLHACLPEQENSKNADTWVYDGKPHAHRQSKYKKALLLGMHPDTPGCKASRKAFEEHLRTHDFTVQSKAFMHAELASFLHAMRAEDYTSTRGKQCPAHVRELLKRMPMLAQALFVLCEQARALYVFDIFVLSVLEHMVLIEDVIASGGVVPNARAQRCARYVEDWTRAVALVCGRCAQ